ncbi:MAG: hypothetical protein H0U49_10540 [Parachlamydiaceae bacterium]|nr:hypothetical protein [Parachlamydiaceae bacterium]
MTNPLLMSQLHGDGSFPSHELFDDPEYDTALDKLADEYVQEEIEAYTATSKILTKEQAKIHLKKAFKTAVRMEEQQNLLNQAVRCIMQDGKRYLSEEEWGLLSKEMVEASSKLSKLTYQEETPEVLFPILGMTQKGMDAIHSIGKKKYAEENFAVSMSLTVLLTTLNSPEFTYWYHLGISCQECGFFEKAIKAYSVCHVINFSHIPSWLFCAECYVNIQNKWDAKIEFSEALRLIESVEDKSLWDEQLSYLKKCLENYKS